MNWGTYVAMHKFLIAEELGSRDPTSHLSTNRELSDIGISRHDIAEIARDVRQVEM